MAVSLGNRPTTERAYTCQYGHTYFLHETVEVALGERMCGHCYDINIASDAYKERFGMRPRITSPAKARGILRWLESMAEYAIEGGE